jgi:hypothetical protein
MRRLLLAGVILMGLVATSALVNAPEPMGMGGPDWDRVYAGP